MVEWRKGKGAIETSKVHDCLFTNVIPARGKSIAATITTNSFDDGGYLKGEVFGTVAEAKAWCITEARKILTEALEKLDE
ncbi:hypothetical protein [Sneathiella sp.]|uniref:hypothetical protein n=1 Tax=Sneathiella sp. TaxID=1964365 RepID=UPI00356B4D80